MRPWSAFILLLLILLPGFALAQEDVTIEVDPDDTSLAITGRLGESNAFMGNLRLTARGGDVMTFTFLDSDLKRQDGDEIVGRQNISLIGDPTLTVDVPKDFQVSVTGIDKPGTYQGQIEILLPGQPRSEALVIDLTVVAKALPNLTLLPGTDQIQLRLVNCGWAFNCALARWLLPASAFLENWQLQFGNETQADVVVLDVAVSVLGEQTGYQLTKAVLALPTDPHTLAAGHISALPLTIYRSKIPPDHYTGSIYLRLDGRDERLKIPVDLNVRVGPFWPLLALLLGIALGRLFKYMQERGQPQAEALAAVNDTAVQVNRAQPDDQKILRPMLDDVRQLVYREKLETVTAQLAAIENRLLALQQLRQMETALQGKQQHPEAKAALQKIVQARQLIGQKEDDQAKALIEEVRTTLDRLQTTLMSGGRQPDPDIAAARSQADEAARAMDQAAKAPPVPPVEAEWRQKLKDALVFLSGLSNEIRAEATLWLIQPLLYLALLIGLLAVGLSSLYIDKGLTFGANPFADYLGLVLWGLSADVASRSLSNLPGG
jgi:hypothetical protein